MWVWEEWEECVYVCVCVCVWVFWRSEESICMWEGGVGKGVGWEDCVRCSRHQS